MSKITFEPTIETPKPVVVKKSMFDILEDYNTLMRDIEMAEGEVTDKQLDELNINKEELEAKLLGYKNFIRHLKSSIEFNKEDRKKSTSKDNSIKNTIKNLNSYVVAALNSYGDTSKTGNKNYKGATFSVYNKSTKALGIPSATEDAIADRYITKTFNISITKLHTNYKKILSLAMQSTELGGQVDISHTINKPLLLADLKADVYTCDNVDCPANISHLHSDCECDDVPYLINNVTPVFR